MLAGTYAINKANYPIYKEQNKMIQTNYLNAEENARKLVTDKFQLSKKQLVLYTDQVEHKKLTWQQVLKKIQTIKK